jgi:tetratricopeptide (TPR) repeat protein
MKILRLIIIINLIFMLNCEKDNGTEPSGDAALITEGGWVSFQYKGYQAALDKFEEAISIDANYADAYNGAGWANARLSNLTDAISNFNQAISLNSTFVDALAGIAFAYNAQKMYEQSNSSAIAALNSNSNWIFSRDTNVDYNDLYLVIAANYFALGNLTNALEYVQKIDPSFNVDVSTYDGKAELAEKIENLRSEI